MSETVSKKPKVGGLRNPPGGRPPGVKNKATRAREARLKRALRAELAEMTPERAQELADDPFQALTFILRTHLKAGDLSAAASTARELLPYCKSKKASVDPDREPLPADLMADPPPEPDEPTPENIIDPQPRLSD